MSSDYELKYSFDNINGDGTLFSCYLFLINDDSKFELGCNDLKYYVNDTDYTIYKNGEDHIYDKEPHENEIFELIQKLEKTKYPIDYNYTYINGNERHSELETFDIHINKNKTKICNATVNTSNKLTQSIIRFFKDIITGQKMNAINKFDICFSKDENDKDHKFFLGLYNSDYATDQYKKTYKEAKKRWLIDREEEEEQEKKST